MSALDLPVTIDCLECPLGDVVTALSLQSDVPVYMTGELHESVISLYGTATLRNHLEGLSASLGAELFPRGDAWILRKNSEAQADEVLVRDFGKVENGQALNDGYSILPAPGMRRELLSGFDFRPVYAYVDLALVNAGADADLEVGAAFDFSAGVESGSILASIGIEQGTEATIDVGEARYVRQTTVIEGVVVEQKPEEIRIPRELVLNLLPDSFLRIEANSDIVRGEASGLPEIARTSYQTVGYVDQSWRVMGVLTERQTGVFLAFASSEPSARFRHRGRSSILCARVREQRPSRVFADVSKRPNPSFRMEFGERDAPPAAPVVSVEALPLPEMAPQAEPAITEAAPLDAAP